LFNLSNNYPTTGSYFLYSNCPYGWQVINNFGQTFVDVQTFASERVNPDFQTQTPSWQRPIADIVDPQNGLRGRIVMHPTKAGVQGPHPGPDDVVLQGARRVDIQVLNRPGRTALFGRTQSQQLPSGSFEAVQWDSVVMAEPLVALIVAGQSTRIQPRAQGSYNFEVNVQFAASSAGNVRIVALTKVVQGVEYTIKRVQAPPLNNGNGGPVPATMMALSATDDYRDLDGYYQVRVLHDAGGALDLEKSGGNDVYAPTVTVTKIY
jgi:hypothetical protein